MQVGVYSQGCGQHTPTSTTIVVSVWVQHCPGCDTALALKHGAAADPEQQAGQCFASVPLTSDEVDP